MKLTPAMRKLLGEYVTGADPNTLFALTQAADKRAAHHMARTMLALLRVGALQAAPRGGLELSEAGRKAAGGECGR